MKKKIYKKFNRNRQISYISPNILANADNGSVIFATPSGYYEIKRIEFKNGAEIEEVTISDLEQARNSQTT